MDIFDVLTMLGGLCLFLFGMDTMSGAVTGLKNEAWFTDLFLLFVITSQPGSIRSPAKFIVVRQIDVYRTGAVAPQGFSPGEKLARRSRD